MSFSEFKKRKVAAPAGGNAPSRVERHQGGPRAPITFLRKGGSAQADRWLGENLETVRAAMSEAGAVLLRGFDITTPEALETSVAALDDAPMRYVENTSPRTALKGEIKTSTDHPADQSIEMHSEQSYSRVFPLHLFLSCAHPALTGGATPIADTRRILKAIPPEVRGTFDNQGYLYRRIYYPGLGPDWRDTYLVEDRDALEAHLAWAGISWRWLEGDILRTDIRRSSVGRHPVLGVDAWFSHLLFWHHSSLEPDLRQELLQQFGEYALPHGVLHVDGSPISQDHIDAIRHAHRSETYNHQWQSGDLLILDNVLRAHGREPYTGDRKILFAMAVPVDASDAAVNWLV